MSDIALLKLLSNRDHFDRFRKYVKTHTITKETERLLTDYEDYWTSFGSSTDIDWPQFETWFKLVKHTGFDAERHAMFTAIIQRVAKEPTPDKTIIDRFIELDYTAQIREVCDKIIRSDASKVTLGEVPPLLERFTHEVGDSSKDDTEYFVTSNISDILDDVVRSHGLEWRLEDLNISIGPVHGGDFILVGARPETGKTTFLCSEMTHMTPQLPPEKEAILFNNEEDGRKLFLRLVQSALNMTVLDVAANEATVTAAYAAAIGDLNRIKVVHKDSDLSIYDIERFLKKGTYGLVGINVLDKLRGFDKEDNDVSRMRRLTQFIRNLAVKYKVPIMAVMQADASGEGKAWLDMSQLYGSKTGVQGEADVIIMVGNTYESDTRFISVPKNKLPGGSRTKPSERHGKFEVRFDPERGRYASKYY